MYKDVRTKNDAAGRAPLKVFPFSSARKRAGVLYEVESKEGGKKYRLYMKGASEIVLALCAKKCDQHTGAEQALSQADKQEILGKVVTPFAKASLRTIALAYMELHNRTF